MKHISCIIGVFILIFTNINCNNSNTPETDNEPFKGAVPAPATLQFTILAQHPHDTSAYTQGLELHDGKLYEGTGDYETSSLRITDWKTGSVEKKHIMGTAEIFGEGITIFNNKIYQLTWENNIVYVYNLSNIDNPIKTFDWPNEGWGLTNNGKELIVSDGTASLYFVDPETFKIKHSVTVSDNYGMVNMLNELEYVDGYVYANIYETNNIVKIDPANGHVVGKIYLRGLLPQSDFVAGRTNVLNGIAYDSTTKTFLITGKRWPKLFEMKLN